MTADLNSDVDPQPQVDADKSNLEPEKARSRLFQSLHVILLIAALLAMFGFLALGVAVRRFNLLDDYAVGNIVFLICAFLGALSLVGWLSLFAFRGWKRLIPPVGLLLLIAAPFPLVKIREVDGEMIPIFAWRFAPDPDEKLAVPQTTVDEQTEPIVDLATVTPEDFPRFLGRDGDNHVKDVRLQRNWEFHPPKLVWQQPIGAGWSAFAVRNGYAVTMEQRGPLELVTCYDVADGELKWSHGIETRYETILGGIGPRATPTIDEKGVVYANGATGILRAIDGTTGRLLWQKDVLEELDIPAKFDADAVLYGRSGSPLVYSDFVVVPGGAGPDEGSIAGSATSLVAFDRETGELRWRGGHEQIGYASPVLATIDGVQQVVSVNESSVSGHDAQDGRELWQFSWPGGSSTDSNNSQPVVVSGDRVFVSKSYGVGAALHQVKQTASGRWQTEPIWHESKLLKTKFTNVVIQDGYIYGLSDGILECVKLDTGERTWKKGRFHQGQILGAGDVLLVSDEKKGEISMIAMSPKKYEELGTFQALETDKIWNHLALYGKYLLVRDAQTAVCWELATKP